MKISSSQQVSAYRSPAHAWPSPAMSARSGPDAAPVQQPDELPLRQVQVQLLAPRPAGP